MPQEDKSSQTDVTRPRSVRMNEKKAPIKNTGDSMLKNIHHHVQWRMEGRGCTSMSGAQTGNIRKKVEEEVVGLKDCLLSILGSGNSLEYVG